MKKSEEKSIITNDKYDELTDIYSDSYLQIASDRSEFNEKIKKLEEEIGKIDLELVTLLEKKLFMEYAIIDLTNDKKNYERKISAYDDFVKKYSSIKLRYKKLFELGVIDSEQFKQNRIDIRNKIKATKDLYKSSVEGYTNIEVELTESESILIQLKNEISNLEKKKKDLITNISVARKNLRFCDKNISIVQKQEHIATKNYFKSESCVVTTELNPYMKQYKKEKKSKKRK